MLDDMSHVMLGDMSRSLVTIYAPGVMPNWWASLVISCVVPCAHALECTCARLWLPHVIAVTCATVCACVVVAEGLAGPWAPPPLGGCLVSSCMLALAAWLLATYLIYVFCMYYNLIK